jgi:hypothetical protein
MTEEVQTENLKISATFSRSVSDGNYGSIKAEAWVQGEVPAGTAPADITEKATVLIQTAAVAVWDQLGIDYHVDEVSGLLVEETPAPKAQTPPQIGNGGGGTGGQNNGGSIRVMNPNDQQGELPDWLIAECNKFGITAVWDQRKTATGRQPLFKEAVARGGTGKGKDGTPKGFWAPDR